jgi:hypothetical protein
MGYHTIGRFATGSSALGFSSGFAVKVGNDEPGPHRMSACRPGDGTVTAWGIVGVGVGERVGEDVCRGLREKKSSERMRVGVCGGASAV